MAANWRAALMEQAESDFMMFETVSGLSNVKECYSLHFLQMAAEKLLKGLSSDGINPPEPKHENIRKFVADVKNWPHISSALNFSSHDEFLKCIRDIQPVIEKVERYHPQAKVQAENVEYPWERRYLHSNRLLIEVMVPVQHRYDLALEQKFGVLLSFIRGCFAAYRAGNFN